MLSLLTCKQPTTLHTRVLFALQVFVVVADSVMKQLDGLKVGGWMQMFVVVADSVMKQLDGLKVFVVVADSVMKQLDGLKVGGGCG
jgi:CheY-like chemotaxis protein